MNEQQFLTLGQAAKLIPSTSGKGVSTQTMFRWCTSGCRGVVLPSLRFGRRIAIRPADLELFAIQLAEVWQSNAPQSPPQCKHKASHTRTTQQRAKAVKAAESNLIAKGVLQSTALAEE